MKQRLARLITRLGSFAVAILANFGQREFVLLGGLSLVGYGASLVYWPAAFIVPGAVLVIVAIFGVR